MAAIANILVGAKGDAFLLEQTDTTTDDVFLAEFHVRNAVHQQATNAISAFVNGDQVACAIELRSCGQTGRARANHGNLATGST